MSGHYLDVPIDATREIRVLEIWPAFHEGRYSDELYCTLKVRSLEHIGYDTTIPWRRDHEADQPGWFEALSYTWGTWADPRWVLVDGQRFFVTKNLYLALRRLRRFAAIRRVWVDQICIDQGANDERSNQVSRMGEIFSLASNVLIWLGESALLWPERTTPRYYTPLSHLSRAMRLTAPVWWTRAWVIQERLLARDSPYLTVIFGPMNVRWYKMVGFLSSLEGMDDDERKEVQAISRQFDQLPNKNGDLLLFGPLMYHMQCADPRDKVYSLLGLLKDSHRAQIPVDYTLDVAQVFMQATYADIEASQNLDILCLVSRPCQIDIPALPSWAVDFTFARHDRHGRFHENGPHGFGGSLGEAVATWHRSQPDSAERSHLDRPRFESSDASLTIRALRLDRIRLAIQLSPRDYYWCGHVLASCQPILDMLDSASFDDDFPLRWCDLQTAAAIPDLLTGLPLSGGKLDYRCATALLYDGEASAGAPQKNHELDRWSLYTEASSGGSMLFLTDHGFLGFGPNTLCEGDHITLPYDSRFPIALREAPNAVDRFNFLGLAYVPGVKDLKLHDPAVDDSKLVAEDFVII